MEPRDKFGREIYASRFSVMLTNGKVLEANGYREAKEKPNLFFRKFHEGIFFADMRGTEEMPIWECQVPLFYWGDFEYGVPSWKARRLIKTEFAKFENSKCPLRFSFNFTMHPENTWPFHNNEDFSLQEDGFICDDGFCRSCGKDFQDEGRLCADCKAKENRNLGDK